MCFLYELEPCSRCSRSKEAVVPCAEVGNDKELCSNLTPGSNYQDIDVCSELCYSCYTEKRAALPKLYKHWNISVIVAGVTSIVAYSARTGNNTVAFMLTSGAMAVHGLNMALIRNKIADVNRIAPKDQNEYS